MIASISLQRGLGLGELRGIVRGLGDFLARIGLHEVEQLRDGIEEDVRMDGAGAEAHEAGELMRIARLAGLADEARLHAQAGADEVMMHRAGGEEHRHRRRGVIDARGRSG